MTNAIAPLVDYAATFDSEAVPEEIMVHAESLFLDTMGCIHSGSCEAGIAELRDAAAFWGGNPQSTIFSFGDRTSAPTAAFLNAVMGHANDYDDTHDGALNHGCVTLVPALLATVEALGGAERFRKPDWLPEKTVSGRDFLAALAIGLDISNRLGMAFIPYLHVGWLPTTLWGPFACAAACGRLLGLDRARMFNAFGLAYSQIHANRQGLLDGALSKRIQPGFSASAGVQAAFYAASGISGAHNIVDGAFGLRALYTQGNIDAEYLSEEIGTRFETAEVSIKPYPCCRCSHPVIDAALRLKSEHEIQWQEIAKGLIHLPPQSMGQIGNPFVLRDNPTVDAQFSAQYTAALAFSKGWPRIDDFRAEQILRRTTVLELAGRFEAVEFERDQSSVVPMEMEITMLDGRQFHTRITAARGSRHNPLSRSELEVKFGDCLDQSVKSFSDRQRQAILDGMRRLPELDDLATIIQLFNT